MYSYFFISVVLLAGLTTDATDAFPSKADNSTRIGTAGNNSRQLLNSEVQTAAMGLSSGSAAANPLQSLALLQQLQATTGSNPMAFAAELAAQNKESIQLQNQKQQQGQLAAVQMQQQHVAAAQAALAHQGMINGTPSPLSGMLGGGLSTVQSQQLQQQLEMQKQNLKTQQALLEEQGKPEQQQLSQQQILMAQLIRNPGANQGQLIEQIRQQQTKQQAELLTQQMYQPSIMSGGLAQQQPLSFQQPSVLQQVRIAAMLGGAGRDVLSSSLLAQQQQQQQLLIMRQLMLRQQLAMALGLY